MKQRYTGVRLAAVVALALGLVPALAQHSKFPKAQNSARLEAAQPTQQAVAKNAKGAKGTKATTLFSENFDAGGLPTGWQLYRQDNGVIDLSSANDRFRPNDAWISLRDPDPAYTGDSVMAATSWFTVATSQQANRWVVTPGIALPAGTGAIRLKWSGLAVDADYRDGYQVRVSTAGQAPANFTGAPIFSVPASGYANGQVTPRIQGENPDWTERTITLPASLRGQTIYVAFVQNSLDMFRLFIDDVKVEEANAYEASLVYFDVDPTRESSVPASFLATTKLIAGVENTGSAEFTNLAVNVTKISGPGGAINLTQTIASLQSDSLREATFSNLPLTLPGTYQLAAEIVPATGQGPNAGTVTRDTVSITLSDSVLARDNGVYTGTLGFPAGTRAEIAQLFIVPVRDTLTSITIGLGAATGTAPAAGDTLGAAVYAVNPATLAIAGTPLAVATSVRATGSQFRYYTLDLPNSVTLQPGIYALSARQLSRTNFGIAVGPDNYIPGATFTKAVTGTTWASAASAGDVVFAIRGNFGKPRFTVATQARLQALPLSIYPNPAAGLAHAQFNLHRDAQVRVAILDVTGRAVATQDLGTLAAGNQIANLPVSNLKAGIYMVQLTVEGLGTSVSRLVVE